ncbi:NPCBM/NEW2 domain-containing protein [Paenibacillus sp.]|jgi:hypothetical protein|uniref:NPCBM/NEW2 domain-containing protein n=1 Tax=Paenibacillus sp. TaxID=58172 RepID=UPI00282795B6|nr:NPCBM/NEW2 domain-containing protein [Paenibacillus sp.]MDR0270671.1 NPCBM/NEW2 domain-containing protein [Paenibacillus sp.]
MKDKIKGLVLGIAIGTMVMGTTALAASNAKLDVVLENVKYMFDGVQKQTPQTIIYNGSLYVPAKTMAQGLGKDFTYDSKNKTAWIGKKEGSFKYLSDMNYARVNGNSPKYLDYNQNYDRGIIKIADKSYSKGMNVYLDGLDSSKKFSVDYNLNGKNKKFTGYLGVEDTTKNYAGSVKVTFEGDDNEISSYVIKGGDNPLPINVDLTGVLKFRILFEVVDGGSIMPVYAAIGEPKLF